MEVKLNLFYFILIFGHLTLIQSQDVTLVRDAIDYVSKNSDFGIEQDCSILDTINLNTNFDLPTTKLDLDRIWTLEMWMDYCKFCFFKYQHLNLLCKFWTESHLVYWVNRAPLWSNKKGRKSSEKTIKELFFLMYWYEFYRRLACLEIFGFLFIIFIWVNKLHLPNPHLKVENN